MSLAFLILAHRLPSQVARLFTALYHRDDTFVLHFDWRAPRELHALGRELADTHPNVHVLPARRIVWGGPVMGEVQIEAMATALDCDRRWTHFLNLTGQDFPLKSRDEMIARFAAAPDKSYVSWFDPLNADGLWSNARERLTRYHLTWAWLQALLSIPGIGRRLRQLFGWTNQLPSLPGFERKWPDFFKYYGGANHVALSRSAVRYLVENPAAKRIRRWLRAAGHPDEILFQSVLLNSPFAPYIVNETLREIDFPRHSPHPRTFTTEDLPRLLESPALLARKFDAAVDPAVLDELESRIRPALQS